MKILHRLVQRIILASCTIPRAKDWHNAIALLILFALIYLPFGFKLGFLRFQPELAWYTLLGVGVGSFFMPGLLEELIFRVLLIPHSTEAISEHTKWLSVSISWVLFMTYHLHPFTPPFFRDSAFLIAAGMIGIICTVAYLRSGSLWSAVFIHWLIAVVWLTLLGGLEKFRA